MERFKKTVITFAPALAIFLTILAIRFCPNSEPAQTNPNATPSPISTSQTNRNSPKPSVSTPQTEPGPPTPTSPSSQNEREKFFALLIGVDDYRNSCPALPDLRYACSDIMKIKDALVEKIGVPEANVLTLRACAEEKDPTKRPTRANIEASVRRLLEKSDADATILVVLTGHGFATKSGETAFAPEDVAFAKNGALDASTATSLVALAENLQTARAKSKALIVDACRTTVSTSGAPTQGTARGALKFEPTGLVTLQSCSARETSYEVASDDFCGGVFAHFLVEGIDKKRKKDASLSLIDVGGYASEKTAEYIRRRREAEAQSVEPSKRVFVTSQQPTCLMVAGADFYLSAPNWEAWYREGRALAWGLDGTKIDGRRALDLLTKAAEAGSLEAQAELALLYYDGCEASPPNFHEAYKLAQEPAKSGNPFALKVLGDCYRYGAGVEQNVEEARRRYAEALKGLEALAETDDALALHRLALYFAGTGTARDYEKAAEYCRRAVDLKCVGSYVTLGDLHYCGYGVERDYDKAVELYNEAVEWNCVAAYKGLGDCYYHGSGVKRDDAQAFRYFQLAAQGSVALGIARLGGCYREGRGVDKNPKEAVKLYARAAELYDRSATLELAACYFYGLGVEQDRTKAFELFKRAAEQNYAADAYRWLAMCYENAWGTSKNKKYAKEWSERAFQKYREYAEAGAPDGMFWLGECYCSGFGVERDYDAAVRWFRKAAEKGEKAAVCSLGVCYYNGWSVDKNGAEAIKYFRQAAELGWFPATTWLGECYWNGVGVEQDRDEALRLFGDAAEQGDSGATARLGWYYFNGEGGEPDYDKAVEFFSRAVELNNPAGHWGLGHCYYTGVGVGGGPDYDEAFKLFSRAVDLGCVEAKVDLAECYIAGKGVTQDPVIAIQLLRDAAEQNSARACYNLGYAYLHGERVEKDQKEAVKWFRKGEELGNAPCVTQLGRCYEHSWGVEEDWNEAGRLYRKAAEEMEFPDTDAMNRWGLWLYKSGKLKEAIPWFEKAAEAKHSDALGNLAYFYRVGEGVEKDAFKATRLYREAAELGDASAMFSLSWSYIYGWGAERNPNEAARWFKKAAEFGSKEARDFLGIAIVWEELAQKMEEVLGIDDFNAYCVDAIVEEVAREEPGFGLLWDLDNLCVDWGSDGFTEEEKIAKLGEILVETAKACGEKADVKTGIRYLEQAVEEKDKSAVYTAAILTLGLCRLVGVGGEMDRDKARDYVLLAAGSDAPHIKRFADKALANWDAWLEIIDDDFEDRIDWDDETPENGGDLDGVFDGGE